MSCLSFRTKYEEESHNYKISRRSYFILSKRQPIEKLNEQNKKHNINNIISILG